MHTASAALAEALGIMSGRDAGTKSVVRESLTERRPSWWRRSRFLAEIEIYLQSMSFGLLVAAILTTYVYARLYGMGDFWHMMLQGDFTRSIKNMSEESVELLGYGQLTLAVLEFQRLARRVSDRS